MSKMKEKWKSLNWWKKTLIIVIPLAVIGAIAPKQKGSGVIKDCCCVYTDRDDNATGYKGTGKKMRIKTDEFTCRNILLGDAEYYGDCSSVATPVN